MRNIAFCINLKFCSALKVHEIEVDLIGTETHKGTHYNGMKERRFTGAKGTYHQCVMRGTFSKNQRLDLTIFIFADRNGQPISYL